MKVLMVGLGSIGQRHLRNLKRLLGDEVEILAWRTRRLSHVLTDQMTILPDADLERTDQIKVFGDLDAALAVAPDVVFVTNPSSLHLSTALAAAQAGCHLFVEKPISHNLDDVEELIGLVERKGLVAAVGYQMRYHPCLRLLKSLIEEEAVGPLLSVRHEQGEYMPNWHRYEDYRRLFGARRDLGGGVILSQIHELDTVYWLYGLPDRLFALGGHWSTLEIDVEDVVSLLMECRYADRPLPVHLQQDYLRRPQVRTYQVAGEGGIITADLVTNEVRVADASSGQVTVHRFEGFQRNQMYLDELQCFIACLRGEATPMVGLREGLKSLRLAVAAHRSIETGEVALL
ncbi:MAG: Gfo/Idh/MocA family oxidoreductase [Chloroflexi bacterium]|nr:Gfo/Idh/MocA family oxidoreductase [Chloroflexota bacterium]